MKKILFWVFIFFGPTSQALEIQQVSLAQIDPNTLHLSMYTQATELYYFQTWQYTVSESEICVEVLYLKGFGSKIESLNNQFDLSFSEALTQSYTFTVKVYYAFFAPDQLQDLVSEVVFFPLQGLTTLERTVFDRTSKCDCFTGEIQGTATVFDMSNRVMVSAQNMALSDLLRQLSAGFYVLVFNVQERRLVCKFLWAKSGY